MRDLIVYFHTIVIFIVSVFFLLAADVAEYVLHIDVSLELVLIEEVLVAELAVRVHEGDIAELVHVALLQVLAQSLVSI